LLLGERLPRTLPGRPALLRAAAEALAMPAREAALLREAQQAGHLAEGTAAVAQVARDLRGARLVDELRERHALLRQPALHRPGGHPEMRRHLPDAAAAAREQHRDGVANLLQRRRRGRADAGIDQLLR